MNFKTISVNFYPQTYFQLHSSIFFLCLPFCSKATGVPSRTILGPIHWGMWRFFEKRWRASVSVQLSAVLPELYCASLFPFFSFITLRWCFKQERMKAPSSNFWEAAPISRGSRWLQPIKLPMGRFDLPRFTSWGWHWPAPPPHAVFFSLRLLGFEPWPEIWADWTLWKVGDGHVDDSYSLRRRWTQRRHKGWYVHVLVFAALSFVDIKPTPRPRGDSSLYVKFKQIPDKRKLWVWLTSNKCRPFILCKLCVGILLKGRIFFFQGAGTDEACLIEILCSRSNAEIVEINRIYKAGKFQNSIFLPNCKLYKVYSPTLTNVLEAVK